MPRTSTWTGWSRPLRIIHLLLAIAVTAQLFIGSFMRSPRAGRADTFGFETHEILGAVILVLIIAHWSWTLMHADEGWRHLFPWSRKGMLNVADQLWTATCRQRLPPGGNGEGGELAGFIHGLGLLAVTALVIIGSTFFLSRAAAASRGTLQVIDDVHDVFAVIVWVYWGGHLGITILHSLLRQPVWRGMFSLAHRSTRQVHSS